MNSGTSSLIEWAAPTNPISIKIIKNDKFLKIFGSNREILVGQFLANVF